MVPTPQQHGTADSAGPPGQRRRKQGITRGANVDPKKAAGNNDTPTRAGFTPARVGGSAHVGDYTVVSGNDGTTPTCPAAMRQDAANIASANLHFDHVQCVKSTQKP